MFGTVYQNAISKKPCIAAVQPFTDYWESQTK